METATRKCTVCGDRFECEVDKVNDKSHWPCPSCRPKKAKAKPKAKPKSKKKDRIKSVIIESLDLDDKKED